MDHKARARSTLSKLLMSCQRRIHKSVQGMISYLLGYPEAYSTHSFHKLYFYHLAARLESCEPFDGSHLASVEAATPSSVLIFPEESIQACSDTNSRFRQPQFYTPSSGDYPFRGEDLQGWLVSHAFRLPKQHSKLLETFHSYHSIHKQLHSDSNS